MKQQQLLDVVVDEHARREDDFYRTPSWMVLALLRRIRWDPWWTLFECCAGDGAIVSILPSQFRAVLTNDLVQRDPLVPDFLLDATKAESWDAFARLGPIDVTLSNPTFELTFPIAQHAIERSRVGVILLQRCTWPEPTEDRDEWLAAHPPTAEIRMPRWNFRTVDGKGGSDSACPSWFIWSKHREWPLCDPGMHIVTRRERAELIAEAKQAAWT